LKTKTDKIKITSISRVSYHLISGSVCTHTHGWSDL
jgi:hypothetical protein